MRITTTYKTNAKGTGQILARGNGKQRTVAYDQALSSRANHGSAAGTLALVLFEGDTSRKVAADTAKVVSHQAGHMVFSFGE